MTGKNEERNNNKSFTNTPEAQSPSLVLNATPPASAFQNNITAFHNMNKNIHEEESENDGDSDSVDDEKVKNKIASAMEEQDQVEEAHILEAEFEKANSMMEFDNSWSDVDGLNFFQKDKDEQHDEYDDQQESPTVKQTISSTEGRSYNKEEEEEEESAININVQIENSNTSQFDGQKPTNLPEKANNQEHENKDALKSEEDESNMLLEIVEAHIAEKTELQHHEDNEKLKNDSNLTEKLSPSEIKDELNNYVYEELSVKRSMDDKDEDEIVNSSPEIQETVMNENINEEINDQESVETKTCIDSLNTDAQALQKKDILEDESSQVTETTTSPSSIIEEKQDTSEKLINLKTDPNAEAQENLKEQTETKVEETEKEVISDDDLCENSKESSKFQVGDHIYFTEFLKLPYRHAIVLDVFTTNNGEEKEESMVIADIINITKSHQEGEDSDDARKKSFRIPCLMNFSKNNSQRILQDVYLEDDRNTKDGKLMLEDCTDQDQDSNNKKTVCRCIPQSEYKSWKKVVYGATLKERYLSLHLPGTVTSVKSSHPLLVISRAKYLMANPQLLPPHNSLTSNCECMAVWCKTGTWLTVRTATMLSLLATSPIKSACSAGAFVGSQTVAVSTPAPGVLGWMGFHTTTQMSLAAAQPLLIPAIAVSGALLASGPFVMLHRYKQKWKEVEQKLNPLFWKEFWGGVDEETFQKICSFLFVNEEEKKIDEKSQGNVNEEEQEPGKSDTTSSIPSVEKEEIQNQSSSSTSNDDVDERSENKSKKIQHGENEQGAVDLD